MTASDRIGAIALVVSLGPFLSITVNGRMETVNLAFEAPSTGSTAWRPQPHASTSCTSC